MLTYFCTTGGTSVSDKSLISSTSIVDENERSVKSDPKPPVHPLSENYFKIKKDKIIRENSIFGK